MPLADLRYPRMQTWDAAFFATEVLLWNRTRRGYLPARPFATPHFLLHTKLYPPISLELIILHAAHKLRTHS